MNHPFVQSTHATSLLVTQQPSWLSDGLSTYHSTFAEITLTQQPNATSQCQCHQPHSTHGHHLISSKKGENGTMRYSEGKKRHIHITFITVYRYNQISLLLLLIVPVPNFYQVNFIISVYIQETPRWITLIPSEVSASSRSGCSLLEKSGSL